MSKIKFIVTNNLEGEFSFLVGMADANYQNIYASYESGTCQNQLGFNYYSFAKTNKFNIHIRKIIKKADYIFSRPGQFNILSFKILFLKIFWRCDVIELHLVSGFMPLSLIKLIGKIKKCDFVIHDQSLITGHCITPYGCAKNRVGCGSCPDLLRTNPILFDRTKNNLLANKKFIETFSGRFIFTNEYFKNLFLSHVKCTILEPGIKKIKVYGEARKQRESKDQIVNIGVNISERFEKNDIFVVKILKDLSLGQNVMFHTYGTNINGWIDSDFGNLKNYGYLKPWDVYKILQLTDYVLNVSSSESLGFMFAEAVENGSVPILLDNGPIIKNYNLKVYLSISDTQNVERIIKNDSSLERDKLLFKYKNQLEKFYG